MNNWRHYDPRRLPIMRRREHRRNMMIVATAVAILVGWIVL